MKIIIKKDFETESDIADGLREIAKQIDEDNELAMLARENKCMAKALVKLGYTPDQISDICNGAI